MGGARRYPYPTWVWTPYGGWWPNPKNSTRNFAFVAAAYATVSALIIAKGDSATTVYKRKDNSVTFPQSDPRGRAATEYYKWKEEYEAKLKAQQ